MLLTILIFIPLPFILLSFIPAVKDGLARWFSVVATAAQLLIAVYLLIMFQTASDATLQFAEKIPWIRLSLGKLGISTAEYYIAIDGINLPLILMSALVLLIGAVSSLSVTKWVRGYQALYLLLSLSVIGTFLSRDFFLFYIFFEFMLLPMFFLIGIWGGKRRQYASIKFFLYTLLGSLFILAVMIALHLSAVDPLQTADQLGLEGTATEKINEVQLRLQVERVPPEMQVHTFNLDHLLQSANYLPSSLMGMIAPRDFNGVGLRGLAFFFLCLGFLIKLPSVPVHTWLPDAHVEAPTPVSVVLAGILLKIGGYGLIRFAIPIFPDGFITWNFWLGLLGIISILYGAMLALAQRDLKRLVAFSSISHMGFVLLGLASATVEGIQGAMYMMVSHGILSAALFLIAGVIYDRSGDRIIENYGGLANTMPNYTFFVVIFFFASLGLPGFSGFISEFFVLLGAFGSIEGTVSLPAWMPYGALAGILVTAVYYLWTIQKMFFGSLYLANPEWKKYFTDLSAREWIMLLPLAVMAILLGLMPNMLTSLMDEATISWVDEVLKAGFANLNRLSFL